MKPAMRTLNGVVIAAASMYCFDPTSGRRRRARLRDQFLSIARKMSRGLDMAGRDVAHRIHGLAARAASTFHDDSGDDVVVAERVRSALGRVVSHPGAIHVSVTSGRVELSGAILAQEYRELIKVVESIRGVEEIDERLGVYESARGISALQGGRAREPERFALLQNNWSPAARLLVSTAALGLVIQGLRRRSIGGALSSAAGGALLLRSAMNMPLKRLAGTGGDTIQIRKTLHVNAPVEQVFDALAHYENFPYFMRNVRSARSRRNGHSHWRVAGPAGTTIEWDAETTRFEPNELIAWRTVPHASVRHSGSMRFQAKNGGGACVEIHLRCSPPAGVLGQGLAKLFGVDPKKELDEDLMRLKSFLETGKRARDSAVRTPGSHAASEHAASEAPTVIARERLVAGQPLH